MVVYSFFVKGDQIFALNTSSPDFEARQKHFLGKGYAKQFEELEALSPEAAVIRFKDIKDEERKTEQAFSTGAVFTSLIDVLLKKG
ncbi:hypothetical protein SerAS12_3893 [Serratia sp. AS12]|jgi:gluconate kinase|uniref:hypothetical protein n=1 Tax=Serratia TaxID=613 RepID=UPI00020E9918|nr:MULTISPECIES: hypothetical protein [Serratia]AEF46993.1 hypothetical protein SerAS9_3892 [Serratia plymuthica AS9]AEF51945.1 hypothetical protein SerAS12_3893 [Serratia sp. AS12]AEG29652.1 hypothetical protein SerAS13_3893 [Serratia sp. AS13]MBJ7892095.1 hypothetical protein [Serratia sp. PAMC26656]UTN95684.1 hypothetical protein NLX81_19790 [Serratia plymuthica]